ncbi:glycosyltransferase family 61 protein [Pontibacter ruber]|uniref:Glycosyltransferase family 61 protein n=1 Tax=Pontibacter ruber TaxID=1343895 RepID=A0ABW5CTW1_9BACT|nr:glycosyltransferase family 61 protein [Pontibacter ruber]
MRTLYKKGTRKLKKIFGKFVPYNTRYKPSGVCRITLNDLSIINKREVNVHNIYPSHVTTLNISEDLYQACSDYWKPKRSVETDYMIVEVPNGRVYTDNESSVAIISQYNRVVENVSLNLTYGIVTEPNLNNIFEQRYFTIPEKYEGTVFSLLSGGAGINNISHWFLDVLPRLHLLRKSGLYDTIDWFLVPSLNYDYQTETLDMLGIPREKIIAGDQHTHIAADCVVASTAPRGSHTLVPVWLCQYLRDAFLPLVEDEESTSKDEKDPYIYISRSDSKIRNVLNEKELLEKLEPYGVKTIVSSQLSVKEKIKLFSKAKLVVSATGAGLISMMFCKPGTKVLEIFNEGFVVEPFYDIADKVDLDYEYIICKSTGKVRNVTQGQRQHLKVDVDKVLDVFQRVAVEEKKETRRIKVA